MATVCLHSFSRVPRMLSRHTAYLSNYGLQNFGIRNTHSSVKRPLALEFLSINKFRILIAGLGTGAIFGAGHLYYGYYTKDEKELDIQDREVVQIEHPLLKFKPEVPVSRTITNVNDKTNLKLTLFQYPTCPFCCKVRAFLDYFGIPYDVIEVNPVLRQQTSWTSYKKVPILLVETKDGYQQLNDSTLIISALTSFLSNQNLPLKDILTYYPAVEYEYEGKKKMEILNRYFLMFNNPVPKGKVYESVKTERQWRQWADDVLVHTLSPNVYRTLPEAFQAFNWFSKVGEWDRLFPAWERAIIIYVGAGVMWMVGKMLKKRHKLKEDVRESLYDECKKWMKNVKTTNSTFFGGETPNLADLAVYGVLSSIEGCTAFNDLLENTAVGKWYYPMKERVMKHDGKPENIIASLHNAK